MHLLVSMWYLKAILSFSISKDKFVLNQGIQLGTTRLNVHGGLMLGCIFRRNSGGTSVNTFPYEVNFSWKAVFGF